MKALVTGATGCVGAHLVQHLIGRGIEVRALVRPSSSLEPLAGLPVERATGDVRDLGAVRTAVRGCDQVYHVAAIISAWERQRDEVWTTNVGGTQNVIDACRELGVGRLIHTSSAAAVGYSTDPAATLDENAPYNFAGMGFLYQDSKREAEERVMAAAASGVPAVVCNPTLVFGAWDRGNAVQLLRMGRRGGLLLYPPGGTGCVWADDVARGLVLAAERGRVGRRYLLNGENLPFRDLFRQIRRVVGGPGTWMPMPRSALRLGALVSDRLATVTRREPSLTPSRAFMLSAFQYVSDHRARVELEYEPRRVIEGLQGAADWLTREDLW